MLVARLVCWREIAWGLQHHVVWRQTEQLRGSVGVLPRTLPPGASTKRCLEAGSLCGEHPLIPLDAIEKMKLIAIALGLQHFTSMLVRHFPFAASISASLRSSPLELLIRLGSLSPDPPCTSSSIQFAS